MLWFTCIFTHIYLLFLKTDPSGRHSFLFHSTGEFSEAAELESGRTGLKSQIWLWFKTHSLHTGNLLCQCVLYLHQGIDNQASSMDPVLFLFPFLHLSSFLSSSFFASPSISNLPGATRPSRVQEVSPVTGLFWSKHLPSLLELEGDYVVLWFSGTVLCGSRKWARLHCTTPAGTSHMAFSVKGVPAALCLRVTRDGYSHLCFILTNSA